MVPWKGVYLMPKVDFTIITPVFNGEEYIRETVNSVLENLDPKFTYEYLIINDGSIDKTSLILEDFYHYPMVRIFHNKNI